MTLDIYEAINKGEFEAIVPKTQGTMSKIMLLMSLATLLLHTASLYCKSFSLACDHYLINYLNYLCSCKHLFLICFQDEISGSHLAFHHSGVQ